MTERGSVFWHVSFRIMYRFLRLIDPLIRSWQAQGLPGLDGVVRLSVAGRRSGRVRRTLLTLLHVGDRWYVGHPDGETGWTRNVDAAGVVSIDPAAAGGDEFRAVRLVAGPERDAVVGATSVQQPFPANLIYRAAARHVHAAGVYFRLEASRSRPGPPGGAV